MFLCKYSASKSRISPHNVAKRGYAGAWCMVLCNPQGVVGLGSLPIHGWRFAYPRLSTCNAFGIIQGCGERRLRVWVIGQLRSPLFCMMVLLYPCCGRLTASLRGPNIIKLLCSFCANAGICWWCAPFAARGEYVGICGCAGRKRGHMRERGMVCLAAYTGWRRLGAAGAVAEEFFSSVGFNVGGYYG